MLLIGNCVLYYRSAGTESYMRCSDRRNIVRGAS